MLPANPAGEIELTDAQLADIYGIFGDGQQKTTNEIDQDVNQKVVATYGNKIAEFLAVWCIVENDADLKAKVEPEEKRWNWSSYY